MVGWNLSNSKCSILSNSIKPHHWSFTPSTNLIYKIPLERKKLWKTSFCLLQLNMRPTTFRTRFMNSLARSLFSCTELKNTTHPFQCSTKQEHGNLLSSVSPTLRSLHLRIQVFLRRQLWPLRKALQDKKSAFFGGGSLVTVPQESSPFPRLVDWVPRWRPDEHRHLPSLGGGPWDHHR